MIKLNVIIASTRPGRKGPAVASWLAGFARAHGAFDVTVTDLADLNLPLLDEPNRPILHEYTKEHTRNWASIVDQSEAFVFVLPEYDHFPPASLVNALQYLAKEWFNKPVMLVSYGGLSGGFRSATSLMPLLTAIKLVPTGEGMAIPFFEKHIEDGVFHAQETHEKSAMSNLNELAGLAEALRTLRR